MVANVEGFWTPFLSLLAHMKSDAFIRSGLDISFTVVDDAAQIVPTVVKALARTGEGEADLAVIAKF